MFITLVFVKLRKIENAIHNSEILKVSKYFKITINKTFFVFEL